MGQAEIGESQFIRCVWWRLFLGDALDRLRLRGFSCSYTAGKAADPWETSVILAMSVDQNGIVIHKPAAVILDMFQEARRRDPEMKRPWAILVGGGMAQLDRVLGLIRQYRPDVALILDFIHVLECLWKAAYGFHAVGSLEAEKWVAERARKILQGEASEVARGLRQSAILHQLSSDNCKAVDKCTGCLTKYVPMFEYDQYRSEGLPIATGIIEGACRHLIKDRTA